MDLRDLTNNSALSHRPAVVCIVVLVASAASAVGSDDPELTIACGSVLALAIARRTAHQLWRGISLSFVASSKRGAPASLPIRPVVRGRSAKPSCRCSKTPMAQRGWGGRGTNRRQVCIPGIRSRRLVCRLMNTQRNIRGIRRSANWFDTRVSIARQP
jgi:hypothetical protein